MACVLQPDQSLSRTHPMPGGNWIGTMSAADFGKSLDAKMSIGNGSVEVIQYTTSTEVARLRVTAGAVSKEMNLLATVGATTFRVEEGTDPADGKRRVYAVATMDGQQLIACDDDFDCPGSCDEVTFTITAGLEAVSYNDDAEVSKTIYDKPICPPIEVCPPEPCPEADVPLCSPPFTPCSVLAGTTISNDFTWTSGNWIATMSSDGFSLSTGSIMAIEHGSIEVLDHNTGSGVSRFRLTACSETWEFEHNVGGTSGLVAMRAEEATDPADGIRDIHVIVNIGGTLYHLCDEGCPDAGTTADFSVTAGNDDIIFNADAHISDTIYESEDCPNLTPCPPCETYNCVYKNVGGVWVESVLCPYPDEDCDCTIYPSDDLPALPDPAYPVGSTYSQPCAIINCDPKVGWCDVETTQTLICTIEVEGVVNVKSNPPGTAGLFHYTGGVFRDPGHGGVWDEASFSGLGFVNDTYVLTYESACNAVGAPRPAAGNNVVTSTITGTLSANSSFIPPCPEASTTSSYLALFNVFFDLTDGKPAVAFSSELGLPVGEASNRNGSVGNWIVKSNNTPTCSGNSLVLPAPEVRGIPGNAGQVTFTWSLV